MYSLDNYLLTFPGNILGTMEKGMVTQVNVFCECPTVGFLVLHRNCTLFYIRTTKIFLWIVSMNYPVCSCCSSEYSVWYLTNSENFIEIKLKYPSFQGYFYNCMLKLTISMSCTLFSVRNNTWFLPTSNQMEHNFSK